MSGALGLLDEYRQCSFRGVPFAVIGTAGANGRKVAVHDYPFRDTPKAEDLGRRGRGFRVRGFMTGLLYQTQFDLLLLAVEQPGPGLLVHPTRGILQAAVLNFDWREPDGRFGVIEFDIEFLEQKNLLTTAVLIAASAVIAVGSAALAAACASDYAGDTATNLALGAPVQQAASASAVTWAAQAIALGNRPDVAAAALAGLPTYYGRFVSGNALVSDANGTVDSALDAVGAGQAALAVAVGAVASALGASALAAALLGVPVALAALVADPATQITLLVSLASYAPVTTGLPGAPIGVAISSVQLATAALCRRAALVAIAPACAAYQPTSFQDAEAMRTVVARVMSAEALSAADAGDTASFQALRDLQAQVMRDLAERASQLPQLVTVTRNISLPAPLLAQQLYADGTRASDLIRRAVPIHPAFMPTSFMALAS